MATTTYFAKQESVNFNETNVRFNKNLEANKWKTDFTVLDSYETKSGTAVDIIRDNRTGETLTIKGAKGKKWWMNQRTLGKTFATDF